MPEHVARLARLAYGLAHWPKDAARGTNPGGRWLVVRDRQHSSVTVVAQDDDEQARSVLSYMRKLRAGVAAPQVSEQTRGVSLIIGRYCSNCHMIDGDGGSAAPDLSRVGATRDEQ